MEASAGRGLSDWLSKKWLVWLSYEYPWVGWCCLSPLSDFILSVCLVIPWISLIGYCLSSDYYQACVWLQVLINLLQDKWSAVYTYPPSNTTIPLPSDNLDSNTTTRNVLGLSVAPLSIPAHQSFCWSQNGSRNGK